MSSRPIWHKVFFDVFISLSDRDDMGNQLNIHAGHFKDNKML